MIRDLGVSWVCPGPGPPGPHQEFGDGFRWACWLRRGGPKGWSLRTSGSPVEGLSKRAASNRPAAT